MYGPDEVPEDIQSKTSMPVYRFDEFVKLGASMCDLDLEACEESQKPNEITTLIYTSGMTGPPKAAMITHDNITWTAKAQLSTLVRPLDNDDHIISYLPLFHIAAQQLDKHCPLQTGCQIWFALPDALRWSLGVTLKDVRPTVFFGVPRVCEKMYDKMQDVAEYVTGIKKKLSTWAKGQSASYWKSQKITDGVDVTYACLGSGHMFYPVAKVLPGKVRKALGFDRCFVCFVSAAPIEVKILEYFFSVDIPILELFRLSRLISLF